MGPRKYNATILADLDDVFQAAKNCGLTEEFFGADSVVDEQLDALCIRLSVSRKQVVLLSIIAARNEFTTSAKDVARYCDCSYLKVRQFDDEFYDLLFRDYIVRHQSKRHFVPYDEDDDEEFPVDDEYRISPELFCAWCQNEAFVMDRTTIPEDPLDAIPEKPTDYTDALTLLKKENVKACNLIDPDRIQKKDLFYNAEEFQKIAELCQLLHPDNYTKVIRRMENNGMRKGVCCLLYGPPGTGKTELVYQVARETGRPILRADFAELRNRYIGDSEKAIRGIFRTYKSLVNDMALAPILLLNEVDGLLGKRVDVVEGCDQLNNACQSILLEELESLDGILIATSNLPKRMDSAYDRRFLFKIEITNPDEETSQRIWKSMVPELSDADAQNLACMFKLSGGQIENVVRRKTIQSVLHGEITNFNKLKYYCEEELKSGKKTNDNRNPKIGFRIFN